MGQPVTQGHVSRDSARDSHLLLGVVEWNMVGSRPFALCMFHHILPPPFSSHSSSFLGPDLLEPFMCKSTCFFVCFLSNLFRELLPKDFTVYTYGEDGKLRSQALDGQVCFCPGHCWFSAGTILPPSGIHKPDCSGDGSTLKPPAL